ncbi:MAG: S-layer homology domain-containing protein [Evtepia sp.]|nr:S-layer homology domain-containing protein [Evtepia sp.]
MVIQAGQPLNNVPVNNYKVKLALPSGFASKDAKLSIKHTKGNGSVEYYTGTVSTEGEEGSAKTYVTFTTNGFSPFVIYAASANVASIGDGENEQVFTSFQAAVDAVENGGTIKALKNIDSTVSGNKTFTVNAESNTVTLTAASGYNLTKNDNVYTVSRQHSGSSSSGTTTSYNVNVNAATNGTVAADKKTASKGTTVTVTASPSKGYVVDAVKVVDKDGKDVAVTEKDGKYVFTMPASAVTVTGSFKAETPAPVALPFTDVKSGNWFYDAVKYAYAQGLMTGTSATTFAPNGTMNRAMIVTVLYRLEKSPAVTGASKFTDVPAGQWYSDAVAWAAANKIVNGYDETTFGPMNAVTREQMAAILFRYEQVKGLENVTLEENLNRFPDQNKISAYAIPALQWAVGQKIINGNADGTLDPTGTATRAQVAQIFTNLLNK